MARIVLKCKEAGTITIYNRWITGVVVNGTTTTTSTQMDVDTDTQIIIEESTEDQTFRYWKGTGYPLVDGVSVDIIEMPSMDSFTSDSAGTTLSDNAFYYFNQKGYIKSFPEGSLDTSQLVACTNNCFGYMFNQAPDDVVLPEGSFRFDMIDTVGNGFCSAMFQLSENIVLPEGSFNTENIREGGNSLFNGIFYNSSIELLPLGSFKFDNLETAGTYLCSRFLEVNLKMKFLPEGSFRFPKLISLGYSAFSSFNANAGGLIALPEGSFQFNENIQLVASSGLYAFMDNFNNYSGSLKKVSSGVSIKNISPENVRFYYYKSGTQSLSDVVLPGEWFSSYPSGSIENPYVENKYNIFIGPKRVNKIFIGNQPVSWSK